MSGKTLSVFITVVVGFLIPEFVLAEVLWTNSSISYLYGEHYEVNYQPGANDNIRTVITLENATGHSWGDSFFFLDQLRSAGNSDATYTEFSPRLSLGKLGLFQTDEQALIKDLLLSSTIEVSHYDSQFRDNDFINVLYGVAVDLNLPGFRYFKTNVYYADNEDQQDDEQVTVTWALPFQLGGTSWLYDGYVDWSTGSRTHHPSLNWTSQLKWDAGATWGEKNRLFLGIEYVHWDNKFGLKDKPFRTDERNVNLLVKYHF